MKFAIDNKTMNPKAIVRITIILILSVYSTSCKKSNKLYTIEEIRSQITENDPVVKVVNLLGEPDRTITRGNEVPFDQTYVYSDKLKENKNLLINLKSKKVHSIYTFESLNRDN